MLEVKVLGSDRTLPVKLPYAAYIDRVGSQLWDVEHYRVPVAASRYDHIAVAVDVSGECFVGEARCSKSDQYVRSIGHALAVSRALGQMARAHGHWKERSQAWISEFAVPLDSNGYPSISGVALRDYCRQHLQRLGIMPEEIGQS